jgi:hypothetical protein
VAIDHTQLNSSVIRVFATEYPVEASPNPEQITKDEVDFYAHTVLKVGVVQGLWRKVAKSTNVGCWDAVLFRGTDDILDQRIEVSVNWHVWKINDRPKKVGKLVGKNRNAYIGSVIPAGWIVGKMKTGKYNFRYPKF